ncbi:DUF3048 domain-containing protein [Saliterribacillus persicus]|uniref:DUF3048 family protein n=1 Tax=Saliterribacillus persicus TaxID=930114 RepID=A0A368XCV6_9BACI|nr:DUF3048 domain-containing protein [Saliterribacillus persicus]RCW65801.1 DUF3048 family protein [Saliterribacillus persicus]
MRKQLLFLIFFFVAFSLLVACSNDEETTSEPEETEPQTEEVEQEPEPEPEPEPANVYPLTGEKTDDDVSNRIVSVMVNNHPKARPQTGLSQADMVFEILAEGNITRLMAMFQSEQPEKVGPVRSAREYYFNLANDYNGIYVYHGAANFIEDMLKNGAADHINGAYYDNDKELFERSSTRVAPHNSYVLFDNVYPTAEEKGYEIESDYEPFTFLQGEETEALEGEAVTEFSLSYDGTPVRYVYQEDSEKYQRFIGQEQTIELDSEEEVLLDNVFVLETAHQVIDDAGRREIDFSSGGDAILFQKGIAKRVQWENVDGRIVPTENGEQVPFVPGKTWINVIPTSPGLDGLEMTSGAE